jgi:chromosome segregation ATPase
MAGENDMDPNQTARMIEWLDEERRRDKSTIAALEERLAQQQETITTLNQRLNGMESDQASMRSAYLPLGRDLELADQLRAEMQQMIEQVEAQRLTAERESDRRATITRDGIVRPVRELSERLDKLGRLHDEIAAVRAEQDRLTGAVPALQQRLEDMLKKLEEPDRRLTFLEEQRRADARRLSELQSEIPELQKQIEGTRPKLELLEDLALRNEKRALEVQSGERDRREQIQQFIDQQNLVMQQQQGRIQHLDDQIGIYDNDMQRYMERFETWSEAHRQMKRIIDDFERIGERLERRINEVAEMQRLSEDRFRQEWNAWTADDQKRWKQFTLTNDETWRNHDKEFDQYAAQLSDVVEQLKPIREGLDRLWALERARANLFSERYQDMLAEYDTQVVARSTDGSNNAT